MIILIQIYQGSFTISLYYVFLFIAVRVGRYSKKQKQKNLAEIESLSTQEKVREREEKDRKMYALIQKVVSAHESTCFKTNTQAHVSIAGCNS